MSAIRTVPRATVNGYLRTLRVPLSLAKRVTRQQGNETWAPSIAFEMFEAKTQSIAGRLLRDDELTTAAMLREEMIVRLKEARALRAAATAESDRAKDEHRQREGSIARQKQQVNRAARDNKDAAKAQAVAKKQAADERAAKRESAVQAQQASQQQVIDRRERAAKSEALRAESEALDLTDKALQAQDKVNLIDTALEANKEARKSG